MGPKKRPAQDPANGEPTKKKRLSSQPTGNGPVTRARARQMEEAQKAAAAITTPSPNSQPQQDPDSHKVKLPSANANNTALAFLLKVAAAQLRTCKAHGKELKAKRDSLLKVGHSNEIKLLKRYAMISELERAPAAERNAIPEGGHSNKGKLLMYDATEGELERTSEAERDSTLESGHSSKVELLTHNATADELERSQAAADENPESSESIAGSSGALSLASSTDGLFLRIPPPTPPKAIDPGDQLTNTVEQLRAMAAGLEGLFGTAAEEIQQLWGAVDRLDSQLELGSGDSAGRSPIAQEIEGTEGKLERILARVIAEWCMSRINLPEFESLRARVIESQEVEPKAQGAIDEPTCQPEQPDFCGQFERRMEELRRLKSIRKSFTVPSKEDVEPRMVIQAIAALTEAEERLYGDQYSVFAPYALVSRASRMLQAVNKVPGRACHRHRYPILMPWMDVRNSFKDINGIREDLFKKYGGDLQGLSAELGSIKQHIVLLYVVPGFAGQATKIYWIDSCPDFLKDAKPRIFREVKQTLHDSKWFATTEEPYAVPLFEDGFRDIACPQQSGPHSCGLHTIMSAWTIALGLKLNPGPLFVQENFAEQAAGLINQALMGRVSSATIEAFLKCHRYLSSDSSVQPPNEFPNTYKFDSLLAYDEYLEEEAGAVGDLLDRLMGGT
ncbi:MAG: hypothetical protein M1820_001190 [Bogoriella megaspora]|nr:MAG: hypothetical protein M1820_001190 [Bogoriella megaspora]